jgi:hypothetical protein
MNDHLESLRAACHARGVPSESEKIRDGESFWLAGNAIPAEAGHIGLSMGEGHSVIVSESSILEVGRDGELYFVRVKGETTALVRSEAATTIRHPQCDCSQKPASITARQAPSGDDRPGPLVGLCDVQCRIDWIDICWWDRNGRERCIHVPLLVCKSRCPILV